MRDLSPNLSETELKNSPNLSLACSHDENVKLNQESKSAANHSLYQLGVNADLRQIELIMVQK